jgi:pimeloyl-ACP methyl ester carboxylesterase
MRGDDPNSYVRPVISDRGQLLSATAANVDTIDVGGVATSVLSYGDGPPLVLLHGAIECGGAVWIPVIDALAAHHRVIVPDAPGLGESAPVDRLDLDTFSSWLTGLLATMDVDRPILVAHSLLGSMAARFALAHPNALGHLVLGGVPAIGPYRMPGSLRYVAIRFAIRPSPANAERFDRFALHDLDATRRRDPAWYAAFDGYTRARARERHVKRTMNHLIKTQTKPIADDDLRAIAVPTALFWGRHDRMVPLTIGQHAADTCGWPLHVIEDAAHAPQIETPGQLVDALTSALR